MNARTRIARLVCTLLCAATLAACGATPEADTPTANKETQETSPTQGVAETQESPETSEQETERSEAAMETITITVNGQNFEAELEDSDLGRAFMAMLPLELDMSELNGNEKYYYLDTLLPSNPSRPGRIEAGDLMLYGSDCVVLFYQSFDTSYSYTRIGRLTNAEGIAEAAGTGSVTVTFA
ncbi:MAG: hypothetical protein IKF14_09445 [Atopobiaceae bacterium]|nr:hypothetical protein [Atopobiaceae bacterium]